MTSQPNAITASLTVQRLITAWRRRSNRGEFWLSLLVLIGAYVALAFALQSRGLASGIALPFWLVIAARRLHDFNANALWGLIPFVTGFVLGFLRGFLSATGVEFPISSSAQSLILGLISIAVFVVLGSWPGAPAENRYGPAPNNKG